MELNREQERITNPNNELYEYVKRIVAAVKYKGEGDHEDVPSILRKFAEGYENKIKELTEENERLRNRVTATIVLTKKDAERIKKECLERIELDIKAIKADTVRKMQERLKAKAKNN